MNEKSKNHLKLSSILKLKITPIACFGDPKHLVNESIGINYQISCTIGFWGPKRNQKCLLEQLNGPPRVFFSSRRSLVLPSLPQEDH